jgi:ParB family chromosome partitioning protein
MDPILVDPFRCRVWHLHDRLEEHINEETCSAEIRSFMEHGQLVPVLGRRIANDNGYDIELIYGARRLFVARHINKRLLVELRDLSDRDAIIAMDIENRQRRDISPYERGLSYARWLRSGFFNSQEELARELRISASQISRLLKLARLPSVLVGAFGEPTEICEGWGIDLSDALEDPDRRARILKTARALTMQSPRPPAREVYRQVLASSEHGGRKPKAASHDKIIKNSAGAPLFRVRQQRNTVALLFPIGKLSAGRLEEIERAIRDILETEREYPHQCKGAVDHGLHDAMS